VNWCLILALLTAMLVEPSAKFDRDCAGVSVELTRHHTDQRFTKADSVEWMVVDGHHLAATWESPLLLVRGVQDASHRWVRAEALYLPEVEDTVGAWYMLQDSRGKMGVWYSVDEPGWWAVKVVVPEQTRRRSMILELKGMISSIVHCG
jgi:hypothetical protein